MQPEAPPEVSGGRKMSQPGCAPLRRGSAGGPTSAGPLCLDEALAPSAASSPGPQQPPQSLSLLGPQPPAQAGPKKKSGFQITSVTPALATQSANNSIAEDTESYDDLDESHTEDLSSSEILDASLSRATDMGAPGRSSSEETLSNLQEAETPGALSPNQPRLLGLPPQQQPLLINGTAHPPEPPVIATNVNMMNNLPAAAPLPPGPISQAAQAVAQAALGSAVGQPQAAASTSRFRVVKLDSSSEPFRKGRWTCTEYYEREPAEAPHRAVESVRQAAAPEVSSERESTSESSVSSTLSHYTESAGSGEAPPEPAPLHPQAFHPPAAIMGAAVQHPHPPQVVPVQTPPQLHYAAPPPTHLPPGHAVPAAQTNVTGSLAEYGQHPQMLQSSVPPVQPGLAPPGHNLQAHLQHCAAQTQPSTQSAGHTPTLMPASAPITQNVGQPLNVPSASQQPPALNQGMSSVLQQNAPATTLLQPPQSGIILQGMQMPPTGHPQQLVMAQNPPMPTNPPTQGLEPVLQGMTNQQMPAVSPIPAAATLPTMSHVSLSTSAGLASAPVMAQPSTVHNGAQGIAHLPASLPVAQHVPHQIPISSAQFFPPALIQSVANQIADARRLMEHSVAGLPQHMIADNIAGFGVSSALDGSGSNIPGTGQLLPLKTLPLSTPLVDGEGESSSGASVVAIDNKIEQAMDLVKSHLMYAVREEVEVLKEQIKELIEKNSQLEQENSLLKTLASPEQMAQFQAQLQTGSPPASSQPPAPSASGPPGTA